MENHPTGLGRNEKIVSTSEELAVHRVKIIHSSEYKEGTIKEA